MPVYRLMSGPMIYAPGIFRMARACWHDEEMRPWLRSLLGCWEVTPPIDWDSAILVDYTVEGDTVVIEVPDAA